MVVISIIALLSSVILTSLNNARAKARDARRLSDIHTLQNAISLYQNDNNGDVPPIVDNRGDGWDQSDIGTGFMENLVPKYLPVQIKDPGGGTYFYRLGNYNGFCSGTPVAILHFYLETKQNAPGFTACSVQGPTWGHCLCLY